MKDGKNWFEEECTNWKPHEELSYELTACSFPVDKLSHTYTFESHKNNTIVRQVMQYKVKFGAWGKLLDVLIIRKKSDSGIKKFFTGLKKFTENNM